MAILKSVGSQGDNQKTDAKVIQAALNLVVSTKFNLDKKLSVDGVVGAKTISAIKAFQSAIVGYQTPDEVVDPGGRTLTLLKNSIEKGINENSLDAIMAMGEKAIIRTYAALIPAAFARYQVNSPLRKAHFLAQIGHESLSLKYTQELASGAAYEGRSDLGNTQTGDGVRFKGRGLIQLTGRQNYSDYGEYISVNFLKRGNERLIAITPRYALDVSLWFWNSRNLNSHADNDDLRAITRRINGGYNGLDDRKLYLDRAKFFLL